MPLDATAVRSSSTAPDYVSARCHRFPLFLHSIYGVFCLDQSWPKHQVLCCPPSARYRYKEAFKPLFTDTSLAELSRRRQAVVARTVREAQSAGTITAFERSPAPSAPLMDEAVGTSSLFASPVRRQRESAKVHPETFGAPLPCLSDMT